MISPRTRVHDAGDSDQDILSFDVIRQNVGLDPERQIAVAEHWFSVSGIQATSCVEPRTTLGPTPASVRVDDG